MQKKINKIYTTLLASVLIILLSGCVLDTTYTYEEDNMDINEVVYEIDENRTNHIVIINNEEIPWFTNQPYIEINNNIPFFTEEEITKKSFETYSELDELGRCGVAYANINQDLMPTEERGEIGHIKPSGWQTIKYDIVDGNYLYNRCHLIGFQLAGENDNEKNLITGTRYLNIQGMLDFENAIAEYVKNTDNHVLYRVTPIYEEDGLVALGVLMEGYSVEDNGKGICFNVFAYNTHPGIDIDYQTGDNWLLKEEVQEIGGKVYLANEDGIIYIVNTNTKKYHTEDCTNAQSIKEENKETFNGTEEWLKDNGYKPCGVCNP